MTSLIVMLNIDEPRAWESRDPKVGVNSCRKNRLWEEVNGMEMGKQLGLHIRGRSILDYPERGLYWNATKIIVSGSKLIGREMIAGLQKKSQKDESKNVP